MERLLMVMISVVTSAMMLVGIGIFAEMQTSAPEVAEETPIVESLPHEPEAQETVVEESPPEVAPDAPEEEAPPESVNEPALTIEEPPQEAESEPLIIVHTQEPTEAPEEELPEETEIPPHTVSEATEAPTTQEPVVCPTEAPEPTQAVCPTEPPATEEPAVCPTDPPATEEPVVCPTDPPVTQEPAVCPTDAPATQAPEATGIPTDAPTLAPTAEPLPAAYSLYIISPNGWHLEKASVTLRLIDQNSTGYKSVMVRINGDGAWIDVTDRFLGVEDVAFEISENCTLYVAVTDPYGNAHTAHRYVQCFDRENPVVRASLENETLTVQAQDNLSGVAAITICGHRFTDLTNNTVSVRLRDYADNYQHIFIQAEDYVGNLSEVKSLKNPYYDPKLPTPKPTATPIPTLIPTAAPQEPSGNHSGGNSSGGGTGNASTTGSSSSGSNSSSGKATATPIPTLIPTKEPSGTPLPTLFPTHEPTATPLSTETPDPIVMEVTDDVLPTIEPGTGFSTTGNAVARDLLYDKHTNKQFILMQTREGASYYIIIDYDKPLDEEGESYETYFLNMVDARDLFDLVPEEDRPEQYITTPSPEPTDIPIPTYEPTSEPPEATAEPEPEPEKTVDTSTAMMAVLALALVGGGGAAFWFLKNKKSKGKNRGSTGFADYDLDDDDEDYDDEEDSEDEEADGDGD